MDSNCLISFCRSLRELVLGEGKERGREEEVTKVMRVGGGRREGEGGGGRGRGEGGDQSDALTSCFGEARTGGSWGKKKGPLYQVGVSPWSLANLDFGNNFLTSDTMSAKVFFGREKKTIFSFPW
jgi:hypothetical protein